MELLDLEIALNSVIVVLWDWRDALEELKLTLK